MANLITLLRLLLLLVVVVPLAYSPMLAAQVTVLGLLVLVFVMDAIDGWVARLRNESSLFGSVFDIAADRVVENVLWVVLADLDRVPIWVPIVFLVRGLLVDSIRAAGAARGQLPFSIASGALAQAIVAGRAMRFLYALVKTLAFGWLFLLPVIASLAPDLAPATWALLEAIGFALVLVAVAFCVLRGAPVVMAALAEHSPFALGRPARR